MLATCCARAKSRFEGDGLAEALGEYIAQRLGAYGRVFGSALADRVRSETGKTPTIHTGIHYCCALGETTGHCRAPDKRENWARCLCIVYIGFPGGRRAFNAMVRRFRRLAVGMGAAAPDASRTGRIRRPGEIHLYSFDARSSGPIVITVERTNGRVMPLCELRDASFRFIARGEESLSRRVSRGTYTIVVKGRGNSTGGYRLSVRVEIGATGPHTTNGKAPGSTRKRHSVMQSSSTAMTSPSASIESA